MKHKTNRTGGFTIIEVVLVLAVAGLIFLVVFAAIPRLQASRRDNQRKRDAEQLWVLIIEYESNTGSLPAGSGADGFAGAFPATGTGSGAFYAGYLADQPFSDPSGGNYERIGITATLSRPGQFKYNTTAGCVQGDTNVTTSSPVDGSILMQLERGVYCVGGR